VTSSLVRQTTVAGVAVLAVGVGLTGLATGVLLHGRAIRAHDEALLAAAQAWRQSLDQTVRPPWEAHHQPPTVDLELSSLGAAGLPEPTFEGDNEEVVARTEGGTRVLYLPVEIERGAESADSHAVVIARGAPVRLRDSVGFFALAYGLVGSLVVAGGRVVLARLLSHAVLPLERARRDVSEVVRVGQGGRVEEQGPVEVRALLRDVNALLDRLDAAFAAQARFTAEAAHEPRTPVTILRGELDLALRHPRPHGELMRTMASLSEEVDRLGALVDSLMVLARVDSGQVEQDRRPVPVVELVARCVRQEGPGIEAQRGRLEVDLGLAQHAQVRVHPSLAEVALGNLLRNARVHAPGSPVRLSAEIDQGFVVLRVDDAGAGIPPAERERVFDRLVRGRQVRAPGLGLGLPLAREIARRHGGDCAVEEGPLGGARFSLRLPRLP